MPRTIAEALPREDTHTLTSHSGTPPKESVSKHQHTSIDDQKMIFPKGGLRKHHDHTTQHQVELNIWAAKHNDKAQACIPPQEQSTALAGCDMGGERFRHPRGEKHGFPGSGKTISKKHKFIRDLDHRHSKNASTRQVYKWEDEQGVIQDPHVIDEIETEREIDVIKTMDELKQQEEEIEDELRRHLILENKKTHVQAPSDTVSPASNVRHLSALERRAQRRQRAAERAQRSAEEAQRHAQDDVQHPQLAIPPPIIVHAESDDEKHEIDKSAPEKTNVSGITVDDAQRIPKVCKTAAECM